MSKTILESELNPAFPFETKNHVFQGLSKREYFSIQIMNGLMSNRDSELYFLADNGEARTNTATNKAKFCILMADELLKQLEK